MDKPTQTFTETGPGDTTVVSNYPVHDTPRARRIAPDLINTPAYTFTSAETLCGPQGQLFSKVPGDLNINPGGCGSLVPKATGLGNNYYQLPRWAEEIQDLIEHKNMSFSIGNIFKACYRLGQKPSTTRMYDLEKIIWFATRELELEKRKQYVIERK